MKKTRKSSSNKTSATRPLFRSPFKEKSWGGDGTLICPDSVRVKLPFTQTLTPGTTSGGLYLYQYRGNSGFDPDYTGVGLQPNGYDQWSQFYNTYVVVSSEIIVEFVAGTTGCVELVVVPAFNTASAANTKEAAGWRYAKTSISSPTGNATYKRLVSKMATAEICGVPEEEVLFDSAFSSTVSTSPASNQSWYWDIYAQCINGTATLADVIRVTLILDIKFMSPVQQAFSAVRHPRVLGVCCCEANVPCPLHKDATAVACLHDRGLSGPHQTSGVKQGVDCSFTSPAGTYTVPQQTVIRSHDPNSQAVVQSAVGRFVPLR